MAKYHLDKMFFDTPFPCGGVELIQIGRRHCEGEDVVHSHVHLNWFELTVVTDGEGVVSTDRVPTHVTQGDIYLSYPCDVHRLEAHPTRPLAYDFLAFTPRDPALIAAWEDVVVRRPGAAGRVFHDERISYLLSCAIAEFCRGEEPEATLLAAIFTQINTYLLRATAKSATQKPAHSTPAEALCFRVMNHIDTHLYSIQDLRELSELTGYHYSYLSSLFRKTTGRTLFDYFQDKKLSSARLLLREGRLSTSEIADLLGYSSVYAFSKAYRTHFHHAPKEDR